jgi:Tfp pilus assembly protein PilX
MRNTNQHWERGIALLLSILALLLLSAVAVGMVYMASTENSIAANFKSEETEYFAARAGIEEIRDRMIPANGVAPYNINSLLPTQLPTGTNQGVIYILQNNPSSPLTMSNVTSGGPTTNRYYDDELCHDYAIGSMSRSTTPNMRCTSQPSGTTWYTTLTAAQGAYSQAPTWTSAGTSNPVDWKWTRISVKASNSTPYCVDGTAGASCYLETAGVACFDGTSERQVAVGTNCTSNGWNPVYLLTSLAVSTSGTRRLVQAEIAQTPQTSNSPGGLFATGTGCSPAPLDLKGNINTGSFNSSTEGTPTNPPSNQTNTNGNVGANGGINIEGSSASVNGMVASTLPPGTTGCPLAISETGHPTIGGETQMPSPYIPNTPTIPPHTPTSTKYKSNATLTAGTYGDISITASATLTLTGGTVANPAIYNFNSISEAGSGTLAVTGPVVINIAGVGKTTVLDLSGGGFTNSSYVPSYMTINYGGTGAISIAGGPKAYFVLNAPLAALTLSGNSNFYGSAVAQTITVNGNPGFYWDQATIPPPTTNTNPFNIVAMRELSY